jgi:hypothetical protein
LIPIYNEVKSIEAGLNTIAEVIQLNEHVMVIATKLQKKKKLDAFKPWEKCSDFLNIQRAVAMKIEKPIPVLPLKFSTVFDTIFEEEKSITQLMQDSGLAAYHYKEVANQFAAIYQLIDTHHAQ